MTSNESAAHKFNDGGGGGDEARQIHVIQELDHSSPQRRPAEPKRKCHSRNNSGLMQSIDCRRGSRSNLNVNGAVDNDPDRKTTVGECFICYDSERSDAGQLIRPCKCKGDVSTVHHDCLKKWLIETYDNPEEVRCKVCQMKYQVSHGDVWLPDGFTPNNWIQTSVILFIMCGTAVGLFIVLRVFDQHVAIQTISMGCAIIIEYICLRFLGFNLFTAYNRAKFIIIRIHGRGRGGRDRAVPGSSGMTPVKKPSSPTSFVEIDMGSDHENETESATTKQNHR